LVSILIGHVTKKGQIDGPKDLEHNVDCVMYIRRAFRLRPFFVPKNRHGPAVLDPLVLMMDDRGRLMQSLHKECRRLAEADFPIAEVSKHSAREWPAA
jgi:predicted ATP-dependent serine protease